jgi:hypothetical protein
MGWAETQYLASGLPLVVAVADLKSDKWVGTPEGLAFDGA